MRIDGTAVALGNQAILLTGPSGAGKSDLALRLIGRGARLIGDDAAEIVALDGFIGLAPLAGPAAGRLAVRGIGIVDRLPIGGPTRFALVLALVPAPIAETRALLDRAGPYLGYQVPRLALYPFETSAIDKVELAAARFGL